MGQAKKDLEKKEQDNYDSKIRCSCCSGVIPKDDVEFAKLGVSYYLCSDCRRKAERIAKE